jgi:hypothetical protein
VFCTGEREKEGLLPEGQASSIIIWLWKNFLPVSWEIAKS